MTRYYAPQGELHSFERGGNTYQVHADALGSVRALTDSSGAVVAHYEYEAWGGLLATSSDLSGGFAYRFVGGLGVRFDPTTGLYYMRQRWYDAGLGRFLSRDPMGGSNLYAYVFNYPIKLVDPTGLKVLLGEGVAKFCNRFLSPGDKPFEERWTEALKIANEKFEAFGYTPFQGYEMLYKSDEMTGFSADPCACKYQKDIRYEDYLSGNWDVTFGLPTGPSGDESFHTRDAHYVWIGQTGCLGSSSALADHILHELTHVGLIRKYGLSEYWDSSDYWDQVGKMPPGTVGHPVRYFGRGIDCVPSEPQKQKP